MLMVLICGHAKAQKDAVLAVLAKYKLDEKILDEKLRQKPTDYSYDLKETVSTEGKEKVVLAHYDASKNEEERWDVISADDEKPSTAEIKRFMKEHGKAPTPPIRIDDSSYKIEKEDANNLVVSFKPDPASLVGDNTFLKDCRIFLTIDLKTGKLIKGESLNEKPLKIKTFNVPSMTTSAELNWNEAAGLYLPKKETINLVIKLLGQQIETLTIFEYSNFTK